MNVSADARNRALRTFVQGLAVDVLVALALVVTTVLGSAQGWEDLGCASVGFLVAKTVAVTAASYVRRRFRDGSGVPTPGPYVGEHRA